MTVCRGCGLILDVPAIDGAAPALPKRARHGFEIDETEVVYRGLCPTCAAA